MKVDKTVLALGAIIVVAGGIVAAMLSGSTLDVAKHTSLSTTVQRLAADQLRDPSSAQFRNVRVNGMFVCGEINGKNGFGAYSGFQRFYGTEDSASIDPGDDGPVFNGEPVMKATFERSYTGYCS